MNGFVIFLVIIILLCSGAVGFFIVESLTKIKVSSPTEPPSRSPGIPPSRSPGIPPSRSPGTPSSPPFAKCSPSLPEIGNYGVITHMGTSAKWNDGTTTSPVGNIKKMVDTYGVKDVQFFDWAMNYSGVFQAYNNASVSTTLATRENSWRMGAVDANSQRGNSPQGWISPTPNWWEKSSWTDTYFGTNQVDRETLMACIKVVQDGGGRSWAYVQAQTSEFSNLAGSAVGCNAQPPELCGGTRNNDPQTITIPDRSQPLFPFFGQGEEQALCKYINGDKNWVCNSGVHTLPAYKMNGPLARYQCNAWVPIVKALGFSGIHWDLFATSEDPAEAKGIQEFMTVSYTLLQTQGLRQTFNNVFGFYPHSLFEYGYNKMLCFPYVESWNACAFQSLLSVARANPGAVAAKYTGAKPYIADRSCCDFNKPSNASKLYRCNNSNIQIPWVCKEDCKDDQGPDYFGTAFPCPQNDQGDLSTQAELSAEFWSECCAQGARLLILADGDRQIQQDYFPDSVKISQELLEAINKTLKSPCFPTCFGAQRFSATPPSLALSNIEKIFQDDYGLLMHMTQWSWANELLKDNIFVVEPAYTIWHSSLPLSIYRFAVDETTKCPSMGLLYDGNKLKKFFLCMSSIDRDSNSRACCACGDETDPYCNKTLDPIPQKYDPGWDSGFFYDLSNWQTPPHWQSKYCPPTEGSCSLATTGDIEWCKQSVAGCGIHMWEIEAACGPNGVSNVAAGQCEACKKPVGDKYGVQSPAFGTLIVPGVVDHAHQSIYDAKDWNMFMKRTKALSDALKKKQYDGLQVYENEVSIYVDPDITSKNYKDLQTALMDAVVGVLFLPQTCEEAQHASDLKTAQQMSCNVAKTLSKMTGRPIPCVSMTVEKGRDLSLYCPNAPIFALNAPPYNMNIVSC